MDTGVSVNCIRKSESLIFIRAAWSVSGLLIFFYMVRKKLDNVK